MRILITGSNGQLGSELKELSVNYPGHVFYHTDVEDLDITEKRTLEDFFTRNNIDLIINCAAYTAVDKAESESELADKINHLAVKHLAELAKENNIGLIHISTDYVFNGKAFRPYETNHPTEPVNNYGKTKLDGENVLKEIAPANSMIIRTSWVYSSYGNNFVKTMLRLGEEREELNVISDQLGSPTNAADLADFILSRAISNNNDTVKVVHFTNNGVCSWYDFATEIMELGDINCSIIPIPTTQYPTPAKRPYYSVMDKSEINTEFNYQIRHWKESLKTCISKLYANCGIL